MSPMSKESGFISEDIFDVSVLMASYRKSIENERSHRSEMRCEVLDENVCMKYFVLNTGLLVTFIRSDDVTIMLHRVACRAQGRGT